MIDAENLVYDYPSGRALNGVGFVLRAGAVLALVGPNGAGKSTLMRCIAALEPPTEGRVTVQGYDTVRNPREVHAALGYLPDIFGLYDGLSVREALTYAARSRGVARGDVGAAVLDAAGRVGLANRLEDFTGALSRGLRQRLAIAQTIVHRPRVLLLDEPASGLDPNARSSLSALISDLASGGMTIMVSSHILSELDDYCTEMLILEGGRVVGDGVVAMSAAPTKAVDASSAGLQIAPSVARVKVSFAGSARPLVDRIEALGLTVEQVDGSDSILLIKDGEAAEAAALQALVGAGLPVRGFAPVRRTLEAAYQAAQADAQTRDQTQAPTRDGGRVGPA